MATLSDIAKRANCSVNLVSYVLHKKSRPTRERHREILRIASEMGYVSNRVASALVTGRTNNLILIIGGNYHTTIANVFFSEFLYELTHQLTSCGIGLTLYASDGREELDNIVLNGMSDGVMWYMKRPDAEIAARLKAVGLPSISLYVNRGEADELKRESLDYITIDDYSSEYEVLKYLYGEGHRKIVFVGSKDSPRYRAYETFCRDKGLEELENIIGLGGADFKNRETMKRYIELHGRCFTAMVCVTDDIAISMLYVLDTLGISVPGDVSVVGYDDIPAATRCTPPLTTVHQNHVEIVGDAVKYFTDSNAERKARQKIYTQSIVKRDSVARIETED